MTKNYYKAFGLSIESEIICPELLYSEQKKNVDVKIKYTNLPDELVNPMHKAVRFQAKPNEFLLNVDNVAKFHIKNGNQISIEPIKRDIEDRDIRLFLLGSAFGALLHQRELLPLHSSAVQVGDSCVLFCGISGAGKSTTANTLLKKGYKLHSDDISVVDIDGNGQPFVYAGYPQQKLWEDTLLRNNEDLEKYHKVRKVLKKYSVPVHDNFTKKLLPLKKIYVLSYHNNSSVEMIDVIGMKKFNVLKNQTYRFNFTEGLENRGSHFKISGEICNKIPISFLQRPNGVDSVAEIAEILERDFLL